MSFFQNLVVLSARIVLSPLFIFGAVNHLLHWGAMIKSMTGKLESDFGGATPIVVQFMLAGATAFLLLGGLSVLLGIRARWGAVLLVAFLIPAALIFHDFWNYDGQIRQLQMANFMKNITITGGLLMVLAVGPGKWSMDGLRKKCQPNPKSPIPSP